MAEHRGTRIRPLLPSSPNLAHELALQSAGYDLIAGLDEAGRGAWAGPVVAAAVILPLTSECINTLAGVNDSKKLTPHRRNALREEIIRASASYAIGIASSDEIDAIGILPATRLAMIRAVTQLPTTPNALVIDAVKLPTLKIKQDVFFYADSISLSVAAASIIAKTERDRLMCHLDEVIPGYSFARHKGYGTPLHQFALSQHGVSIEHRKTYAPIQRLLAATKILE